MIRNTAKQLGDLDGPFLKQTLQFSGLSGNLGQTNSKTNDSIIFVGLVIINCVICSTIDISTYLTRANHIQIWFRASSGRQAHGIHGLATSDISIQNLRSFMVSLAKGPKQQTWQGTKPEVRESFHVVTSNLQTFQPFLQFAPSGWGQKNSPLNGVIVLQQFFKENVQCSKLISVETLCS